MRLLGLFSPTIWALRLGLLLAALVMIFVPAEVWSQPSLDLVVEGFDSKTVYIDEGPPRQALAAFQVLTTGDWRSCPCSPGSQLTLFGDSLLPAALTNSDDAANLGQVSVLVDGKPARVNGASSSQVNFLLREDVEPPSSTISLLLDGREIDQQTIAVGSSEVEEPTGAAQVSIQRNKLQLSAAPATQPVVHLLTTPLPFRASFDIVIEEGSRGRPFQAMLWNPRVSDAISVVFGPAPERRVEALVSENGRIVTARDLGRYELGQPYHVEIALNRGDRVELRVWPKEDERAERGVTFTRNDAPELFGAHRPSLSLLSRPEQKAAEVTLSNYRLELPHQRFLTVRVDDAKIVPLALVLLLLSAALHVPLMVRAARGAAGRLRRPHVTSLMDGLIRWKWLIPVALAFGAGVGFLITLGSHPFDMTSQKVWTYLLVSDGIADLYYLAQTVPIAAPWNGVPYHEAVYPYGVAMSYYFYAIGWTYDLLGGDVAPNSAGLEITIKATNLLFALLDAVLLLALVRGFGRHRLAWLVPLAFLLNPAVLFDTAVWGETESVALAFVLASLLAAQRSSVRWAWALLALAFLSKQTVVLPAFLIAIYFLRIFPPRRNLEGITVAVSVVVAMMLPYLAAGYPPSLAIDPILGAFQVFGGSEMEKAFQVVSFDAFSIWPLVTLLVHGQHGISRLAFPDSAGHLGPLSYHQVGVVAFLAVVGALALWLLTSRRITKEPALIFLALAFATLTELVLPTRSIARYLVFPMVFALVASGKAPTGRLLFVVATLTLTSCIGMFGSMASGLQSGTSLVPQFGLSGDSVGAAALQLFQADIVITLGSVANLAALLAVAAEIWLPRHAKLPAPLWVPRSRRTRMLVPLWGGKEGRSLQC